MLGKHSRTENKGLSSSRDFSERPAAPHNKKRTLYDNLRRTHTYRIILADDKDMWRAFVKKVTKLRVS